MSESEWIPAIELMRRVFEDFLTPGGITAEDFDRFVNEVRSEAWDECLHAVQDRVSDDGTIDQHRLIKLRNPYGVTNGDKQ